MAAPQAVDLAAVVHYCDAIKPRRELRRNSLLGFIDIEHKRNYSNYMVWHINYCLYFSHDKTVANS